MSNFVKNKIDLGPLTENSSKTFTFSLIDNEGIPEVLSFSSSCNCTKVKFDERKGLLKGVYKAGSIPFHIRHKSIPKVGKITVKFDDNTSEILEIHTSINR